MLYHSVASSVLSSLASRTVGKNRPSTIHMSIQMPTSLSFKLVAIKLVTPGKEHLEKHYEDLSSKPFFAGLVSCMHALPTCFDHSIIHTAKQT